MSFGGEDGGPWYSAGPDDNVPRIISTLERAVGKDGFDFVAFEEPLPEAFSDHRNLSRSVVGLQPTTDRDTVLCRHPDIEQYQLALPRRAHGRGSRFTVGCQA